MLLRGLHSVYTRLLFGVEAARRAMSHDRVRLTLQTVTAVLFAYGWMRWQGLPEMAWAAFSALFVVRASVEGTMNEAAARLIGAFLGVALGVFLVLLSLRLHVTPFWSIPVGVGLAAYCSMRWAWLSYSLVTVTILTVVPDHEILNGAAHKAAAIVVGSISGVAAAAAIAPLSARRSMRANLAISVSVYGELLVEWASAFKEGRRRPSPQDRPEMERARGRAREMAYQAHSFPIYFVPWNTPHPLLVRLQALWRTAPIMERVGRIVLSDNLCQRLGPALGDVAAAVKRQVDELADALRDDKAHAISCKTAEPVKQLNRAIETSIREKSLDVRELEAVALTRWAWNEVARELDLLCASIAKQERSRD